MVRTPEDWPWSSYRAMIAGVAAPEWLQRHWILAAFGQTEAEAVQGYVRFVAEGKGQPSPWEQLKHQVFLGTDAFVESMRRKVPMGRDLREIPQAKARGRAKPLSYYARRHANRDPRDRRGLRERRLHDAEHRRLLRPTRFAGQQDRRSG